MFLSLSISATKEHPLKRQQALEKSVFISGLPQLFEKLPTLTVTY